MTERIADMIAKRMAEAGFNQKSLAKAAGLNETYVRDILTGRSRNPKQEQLRKLADALHCSVLDLLPGTRGERSGAWINSISALDAAKKYLEIVSPPWSAGVQSFELGENTAHSEKELVWLRIYRRMSDEMRMKALEFLDAAIPDDEPPQN